jgi:hypothetical protein
MANTNAPFGIRPYAYRSGAPYNGAVRTYYVPVGNATALYFGDPVVLITNSGDGNGVQTVEIATAGSTSGISLTYAILGSFQGISNNAGQTTIPLLQSATPYLPASTAAYIYVADDPTLLYIGQEDSVGGALASGAAGRNVSLVAGAGSTVTSQSGWQLQSSSLNTTALQFRLIQLLQESDNAQGTNARWLGFINNHPWTQTTGI